MRTVHRTRGHRARTTLLVLLLVASLALTAAGGNAQTAVLQASATAQPDPVVPGTLGRIDLTLTNLGNASIHRMDITLVEADDPLIVRGVVPMRLGGLGAGGSVTISPLSFEVPATTEPGVYHLRMQISFSYLQAGVTRADWLTLAPSVTVQAPPTLFVERFSPDHLTTGTEAPATITLVNQGTGRFVNILGTWTSEGSVLLPLGGSNTFHVRELGPGNSTDVPLAVSVKADAVPGPYALTFTLDYRDSGGATLVSSSTVGVQLVSPPGGQLVASVQDVGEDSVTLAVTNTGTHAVTGVQVRYVAAGGQTVVGSDTSVLGNLAPGEFLTATFDVAGSVDDGAAPAMAEVRFTDSAGVRRTDTQTLASVGSGAVSDDLDVTVQDLDGDVLVLAVTNTGTTLLTGVQLRLLPSPEMTIERADTVALGNLAPGEFKEASFEVDREGGDRSPLSAHVVIAYTDEDGDRRTTTETVTRSMPASQATSSPSSVAAPVVVVLILAIALVVAMFGVRKQVKRKRAEAVEQADEAWDRMIQGAHPGDREEP